MVYNSYMRTSITLDEDVYQLAYLYAKGRGTTLSAAINELVRKAEAPPRSASSSSRLKTAPNGLLVIAARPGRVITPEMVKEALEDGIA
jgi:macrodomain Ter protein organizer (MatP/YcbG family)